MRGLITDTLMSIAAVFESEGRTLRHSVMLMVTGTVLLVATLMFMMFGIGLVAYALYYGLASVTGPGWGALLAGSFVLLVAALCGLAARLLVK